MVVLLKLKKNGGIGLKLKKKASIGLCSLFREIGSGVYDLPRRQTHTGTLLLLQSALEGLAEDTSKTSYMVTILSLSE